MRLGNVGIGLLEVLVGGALVSGLLVTVMKLNESGNQGTAKLERRTEVVYLDREVSTYLGDPASCINSLGTNIIELTSFTGTNKVNFTKLHNREDVLVFNIPSQRGTVTLKQIYLTDYKSTLKSARIVREYEYQVSKNRKDLRTFSGEVTINELSGRVVACVLKGTAGGDGPWIVEPSQISYSGGNVGIGKTLVEWPLDVNGTIRSSGSLAGILLDPRDGTGDTWQWYNSTGDGIHLWRATLPGHTGPSHPMMVANNGNVGIGSLNPGTLLHVGSPVANGTRATLEAAEGTGGFAELKTRISGTDKWSVGSLSDTRTAADERGGFYVFQYTNRADANVNAYRFFISDTGNVGIGTPAPKYTLDVNGSISHTGHTITNASNGAFVLNAGPLSLGPWAGIFFRANATLGDPSSFTDLMTIKSNGNVGIGSTNPGSKLEIQSGPSATSYGLNIIGPHPTSILSESDTATSFWNVVDGSTWQIRLNGYGTSLMSLDAAGNLWIAGTYSPVPSDKRLKKNIVQLQSPLQRLLQIEGVNYHWKPEYKKGSDLQLGVIAQDVEKVFPEAVVTNKDGMKAVNYSALIAPVIEAIRELNSKIATLFKTTDKHSQEMVAIKAQNKELKKANEEMMARLDRMEKMLSESKVKRN